MRAYTDKRTFAKETGMRVHAGFEKQEKIFIIQCQRRKLILLDAYSDYIPLLLPLRFDPEDLVDDDSEDQGGGDGGDGQSAEAE